MIVQRRRSLLLALLPVGLVLLASAVVLWHGVSIHGWRSGKAYLGAIVTLNLGAWNLVRYHLTRR